MLISGCAAYRAMIIDEVTETLIEFNLLCDSLAEHSKHPDAFIKFRDQFFEKAVHLEEFEPRDLLLSSMPTSIEIEGDNRMILEKWLQRRFSVMVQFLFLRFNGIIDEHSPYRITGIRPFWNQMRFLGLKKDDVFVDVGAGSGVVSFILAETMLPSTIYMTELNPYMVEVMASMIDEYKGKITTKLLAIPAARDHLGLPDTVKADCILMREVFHHIKDIDAVLQSVKHHLKEDGRLVIIESTIETQPNKKVRCIKAMHSEEIRKILEKNHFAVEKEEIIDADLRLRLYYQDGKG